MPLPNIPDDYGILADALEERLLPKNDYGEFQRMMMSLVGPAVIVREYLDALDTAVLGPREPQP